MNPNARTDKDSPADHLQGDVAKTGDSAKQPYEQDTPGRPKSSSSRQQTQPGQVAQTGSAELDQEAGHGPLPEKPARNKGRKA